MSYKPQSQIAKQQGAAMRRTATVARNLADSLGA